jgi:hypothetical protein
MGAPNWKDLRQGAAGGLSNIVGVALLLGGFWAIAAGYEWGSARVLEHRCARALRELLERSSPELDAHVDRCEANTESVHGGDVCFVSALDDGTRKTQPLRISCSRLIRGDPGELAAIAARH